MKDSRSARNTSSDNAVPEPGQRIADHLRDIPRSGIRDFFEIVSTREDVISLGIGEPDFVTPWHIRESSIFALNQGQTSYTSNLGLEELRRKIAEYVMESFGAVYDPETEILATVGVSEALDLALRAIINPGDEIVYHQPCYVSYAPTITMAHGIPVPVSTTAETGFRLEADQIEKALTAKTRAIVLNFPTNPTGAVLGEKDLHEIAELVTSKDLLVISDEVYSELTYEENRYSLASLPDLKERMIFLNGFSKAWAMTGFRSGFACAPAGLTEAMMKIHQYTILCAPVLSQMAAIEALRNGKRDIEEMKAQYRTRRNFVHSSLNEMGLPCHLPRGAFYAFPYVAHTGLDSREFSLRLLEQ
jgi:aminotransferase